MEPVLSPSHLRRTDRFRLNRGGNCQANAALFRIAMVRIRFHEPTIAYVAKRLSEGLFKKDIFRCLKCYFAREVYQTVMESFRAKSIDNAA